MWKLWSNQRNSKERQISAIEPKIEPGTGREHAIACSALWAAAGDALGWITELTDEAGVQRRAGTASVTEPVPWTRLIGGRKGVKVRLPAGTYSDDTQLRLAVCRSIRSNGTFDAEAFAKIEMTVWPSYALGAGKGTKAAAVNLSRRDVNWFSNFFAGKEQDYLHGGGNGAAMRIQPHVWAARRSNKDEYLLDVLRNAIITHGHPHGFCGAIFHALATEFALSQGRLPAPPDWSRFVDRFSNFGELIQQDRLLAEFWLPAWEDASGVDFANALCAARDAAHKDLEAIGHLVERNDPFKYKEILDVIGCLEARYRGSGLKTAVAASALSWLYRNASPIDALVAGANALGSDTDTICSMAGAIIGLVTRTKPSWSIQDQAYIEGEAIRLANIGAGVSRDSFAYPDIAAWNPPSTQSDAVGKITDHFAIAGLGPAEPIDQEYSSGTSIWQWMKLSFGQTVLVKRRRSGRVSILPSQLPSGRRAAPRTRPPDFEREMQPTLFQKTESGGLGASSKASRKYGTQRNTGVGSTRSLLLETKLDEMTDAAIRANFDDRTLGSLLNRCIDEFGSVEGAIAFASVIAKAKIARQKRER